MTIIRSREELNAHNQRNTRVLGAGTAAEREAHKRNQEAFDRWLSASQSQREAFNDFWGQPPTGEQTR